MARAVIRNELAAVARSVVGDAELLTSELVTNAVRHAGLGADDSVGLRIDLMSETVRVGVSDEGPDSSGTSDLAGGTSAGVSSLSTPSRIDGA